MSDEREEELPDRRKHGYKELEQKLEEHVADIEKHQKKVFLGGLFMIVLIGITTTISIFAFGIILREQSKQADKLAEQSQTIQDQRKVAYRTICENQNTNNRQGSRYIRSQSSISRDVRQELLILIEVLAPVEDCTEVVKNLVQPVDKE